MKRGEKTMTPVWLREPERLLNVDKDFARKTVLEEILRMIEHKEKIKKVLECKAFRLVGLTTTETFSIAIESEKAKPILEEMLAQTEKTIEFLEKAYKQL